MKKLILLEIPGLTNRLLDFAPGLKVWAQENHHRSLVPELPAVTLPGHAALMTGTGIKSHGVVANGWYHRNLNEVKMWPQSEALCSGEKIWESIKKSNPDFKCFKYFWWPGMGSTADLYGNVRPVYYADGRKGPGLYMNREGLADELQEEFGKFPLFNFWGPATSIKSSKWILDTAEYLIDKDTMDLSMLYLPHLDYKQQSHGPKADIIAQEVADLDALVMPFIKRMEDKGFEFIILSSYNITEVDKPVHINSLLREQGLLKTISNEAGELIDFSESAAFAVADHQCANIYIKDSKDITKVAIQIARMDGVDRVLNRQAQQIEGLEHENSGELLVFSSPNAWFTYYYWLDEALAPDFARTVAIHNKPGYDPCEMILDPKIALPKLKIAKTLLKKLMGMRYVMDVIPLDADLVKGSHGLLPQSEEEHPVCLSSFDHDYGDHVHIQKIKPLIETFFLS